MAPNVLWFEKMAPKTTLKSHKKWPKNFSGNFGEIRAKIFRTPKNLPAPTPMREQVLFWWAVKSCWWISYYHYLMSMVWEAGVQAHPQKFWFVGNSGKTLETWANSLKIRAKMASNVCRMTWSMQTLYFGVHPKKRSSWSLSEKIVAQKVFGQLCGNSTKNSSHLQIFASFYIPMPHCVTRYNGLKLLV